MAMTELALAGAKAAEPVVVGGTLAAPSAGNGSIFTGPRLSLSIAIFVASRPEICRRIRVLLCRLRRPQGPRVARSLVLYAGPNPLMQLAPNAAGFAAIHLICLETI